MKKSTSTRRPGNEASAPPASSWRELPPRIPEKKVTIYDLARMAKVSPGTVSRVLNNRDRVKPETRDLVLRAANQLGLKPQAAVRLRTVAILSEPTYPDRIEGYAATLTAYLSFAFARRKIGVLLPLNPLEELPRKFLDGIVVVTEARALKGLVEELERRIPVVHIDKFPAGPDEFVVCSDHYGAGYQAAQYLIHRGRTRLAFIGPDYSPFAERLRGFKKAVSEAGLKPSEQFLSLHGTEITQMSVLTHIVRLGADGIYAPGSSFEALECLHILGYVMGLKIPEQISLIGGENAGISSLLNPPLTTIEEPLHDMAEQAAAMIDRLTSGQPVPEPQLCLPVRVIERNSVR